MAAATDSIANGRSPRSVENNNSPQSQSRRKSSTPWSHVVRGESEAVSSSAGPSTSSSSSSPAAVLLAPISDSSSASDCQQSHLKVSPSSMAETSSASAVDVQMMESSDHINSSSSSSSVNAGAAMTTTTAKKLAWNTKPSTSNGDSEYSPVMGAHSWPALSESARASTKSTAESIKTEGSGSVAQGPVIASIPQKLVTSNANPNPSQSLNQNHGPARQKSMKRGGNGGGGSGGAGMANGGYHQPPPMPSPTPGGETSQNNSSVKTGPPPVFPDSSPRETHHRGSNNSHWEGGPRGGFISPMHNGNEHPQQPPQQQQRNFRRNNGPHPRGNGSYHNNNNYNGGRQEREHGNYEWNSHRNFNGRNSHMQQQRVVSGNFPRPPPPNAAQFISPPPVPSFGGPLAYPLFYVPSAPPGAMPMVPPQPFGVFVPPPDSQLRSKIARQIDYYFSSENLCKDTFLREQMDDHGFVPISVIAGFKRVMLLGSNIPFILDALRTSSTVVEVQDNKVRRRNDWMNWPRLLPGQFAPSSSAQSSGVSNQDVLADRFKNIGLEEGKAAADLGVSRPSTDELNNQSTSLQ